MIISFSGTTQKSTWYRSKIFHNFINDLSGHLNIYPERFGYGDSMGAFGVSAFADALNLNEVLIISPISTLSRDIVPWETRFLKAAQNLDWKYGNNDGALMQTKGYVVYDPLFSLDRKHASRFDRLIHLKVPGVGHSMPTHLQKMGILNWLFSQFVI